MKIGNYLKFCLLHIAAACSIACIVFKVLDWYNPFMNFEGNGTVVQWGLYISILLLTVLTNLMPEGRKTCSRRKRNFH